MTRVRFKRLMCLLLAVIITALMVPPTPVVAVAQDETNNELSSDVMAGSLTVEKAFGNLDADTVPEIVGYDSAVARTHIARMYEEEGDNLNQVIFLNADGSRTAYFYDHPVKYIDSAGKIKDISLDIVEADVAGQFKTAANSSVTTFSRNVTDGIGLSNKDASISLVPHLPTVKTGLATTAKVAANVTAKKIDSKTVAYTYDDKTTLEYSLTYTGFKEDIVVSEYTGQTEYDFTLYTNGLKLTEQNGSFYLVDAAGTVKAQLGDIIIFTADDRNNTMGDMVAQTVVENQEYLLTILVDPEFLADEKTAYPIRIDPTVEFTYENNGVNAIEDVTINSNGGSDGTAYTLFVGCREDLGVARTLMKFPVLDHTLGGVNLLVTDAKVEIRDLLCEAEEMTVYCYVFSGNEWTESTANWSNVSPYSTSTLLSSHTVSFTHGEPKWHFYAFDITEAVAGWLTGDYNIDTGIIFKAPYFIENGSTYIHKTLGSYNRSIYQPSLRVSYISSDDAVDIDTDVLTSVTVPTAESTALFKFEPESTGFYTFESLDIASGDPYMWLYDSRFELLTEADDAENANFQLTYHFVAGYTYYFRAGCYDTGVGSYSVKLSKVTSPSHLYSSTINWGDSKTVSCSLENPVVLYRFTPTVTAKYLIYSYAATVDPMMWLYDSDLNCLDFEDDGGMISNFRYADEFVAYETYYIAAGVSGTDVGTYLMSILMEVTAPTDSTGSPEVLPLMNMGTGKYLDIHGPYEQEKVHQWSFHTGEQSRWTFARGADGYYTIRSNFGNKYYMGVSGAYLYTDNVGLYPSISTKTQWKLYAYPTGEFLLEPRYAEGTAIYVPDSYDGTELQLVYMNSDAKTKWKFEVKSSTPLEGQQMENWCWAASARMLVNHYFDVPDDRTQSEAVKAVKGSLVDYPGTPEEVIYAARYYRSNNTLAYEINLAGGHGIILGDSTLRQFINDGHVVCIARGLYDAYDVRAFGHTTVIVGYTTIYINRSLEYRYIINDPTPAVKPNPWNSQEITTGQVKVGSYQWIRNSKNALDGDPIDNDNGNYNLWDGYVVVQTDYSDDIIYLDLE